MEDGRGAKVDEFDDIVRCHDAVVEFEVTMSQAHFVEIFYAVANLTKNAVYLWTTHLAGHDNGEEIKWCKFHDLEKMREGGRERKMSRTEKQGGNKR